MEWVAMVAGTAAVVLEAVAVPAVVAEQVVVAEAVEAVDADNQALPTPIAEIVFWSAQGRVFGLGLSFGSCEIVAQVLGT